MTDPVRQGGFLCVTDIGGIQHALRLSCITALRDADVDRTEAMVVINGGRDTVLVAHDMEEIFAALVGDSSSVSRRYVP